MRHFILSLATLALISTLAVPAALAGNQSSAPVEVYAGSASGDLRATRHGSSNVNFGCYYTYDVNLGWSGQCYVSGESTAVCLTTDANLVEAIRAMDSYGYLTFTWDSHSTCTSITFFTDSESLP